MAEPQQEADKKPGKWFGRVTNLITTAIRSVVGLPIKKATGFEPQYRLFEGQNLLDVNPAWELRQRNMLEILGSRIKAVINVEARWDKFESFRKQVEEIYAHSMIYIDPDISEYEYPLYQNGVAKGDPEKDEQINTVIRGKNYQYPVPPKTKIRYPIAGMKKEWIVTINPFGYNVIGQYINRYVNLISKICKDAEESALKNAKSDEERKNIQDNIGFIESIYKEQVTNMLNQYSLDSIESDYYTFVKTAAGYSKGLKGFYNHLQADRIKRQDVLYYNTYKVIQPKVYGVERENAVAKEILVDEKDKTDYTKIYGPQVKVIRWRVKENEMGPGLDAYGYPLEVDDDGIVIIDKHHDAKGPQRRVPPQFVKDLDLLEAVNYMNAHFDTYRDDLRDGRYHPHSLTIMEYVQANSKSIWDLWNLRNEEGIKSQSIFKVPKLTETGENGTHEITIRPSDKDPAFDLTILQKGQTTIPTWRHAGRKYYYDVPDGTMKWHNQEKHLSSRGVSMYIIDKVTRQMERFDEAIQVLKEIGMTHGFDYGTRPWDMWAKEMIQDVYGWRQIMERVNTTLQQKYSLKDFQEMYSIK
ncbi:hypothetical protein HYX02_04535 [Candidatus Woesearchaeota archaeon]|nr:hypothetical protein [Candidatus Woesearchaeota archaeon]